MSFPFDLSLKYKKDVVEHILRIDKDEFEICQPKVIKKRVRLIGQKVYVVHVKSDGIIYKEIS